MHELISAGLSALIAVVTTVGSIGFLTARATRRNINADTEVTLSDTAIARMVAAEARVDQLELEMQRSALEMQRMRRKFFAYELWADQHQSWDKDAVDVVEAMGGHLRPPPLLVLMKEG